MGGLFNYQMLEGDFKVIFTVRCGDFKRFFRFFCCKKYTNKVLKIWKSSQRWIYFRLLVLFVCIDQPSCFGLTLFPIISVWWHLGVIIPYEMIVSKRNCEHYGMLLQLVGVRFFGGQFFLYDRSPETKTDMSSFRVFFFFVTFYTFFTYFITLNKPPLQIPWHFTPLGATQKVLATCFHFLSYYNWRFKSWILWSLFLET